MNKTKNNRGQLVIHREAQRKKGDLKVIDFFCGAGGMSYGFQKAGIRVVAGIDIASECRETYESNIKGSKFIYADVKELTFVELESHVSIQKKDDSLIFIGCSPCQYWTTIKTTREKSKDSKDLLVDFRRFVSHYLPGFVVIENVPGLYTREGSPLKSFLRFLKKNGYTYRHEIVNAAHFGVPQTRKRFLLIASRVGNEVQFLEHKPGTVPTVRDFIGAEKDFPKLTAGHTDTTNALHTTAGLSPKNLQRIRLTPHDGGTRLAYVNKKRLAVPSQYKNSRTFADTYSRMFWDKPAPTITTKFVSLSNGRFGHPDQDRALSLREGAALQTFAPTYTFFGSGIASISRQIGNAVPPLLSQQIAEAVIKTYKKT